MGGPPQSAAARSRDRAVVFNREGKRRGWLFYAVMVLGLAIAALAVLAWVRRPRSVRVETQPPGAELALGGGKSLGLRTPSTLKIRGKGHRLIATRPGYQTKEFALGDGDAVTSVALEPSCAAEDGERLRLDVGSELPPKVLDAAAAAGLTPVGRACASELSLVAEKGSMSLLLTDGSRTLETWPIDPGLSGDSVVKRLKGATVAWRLTGGMAPRGAEAPWIEILRRGSSPGDVPRSLAAGSDHVAYRIQAPGRPVALFEVGPDGSVALLYRSSAGPSKGFPVRIPSSPTDWIEVAPPKTLGEVVVALSPDTASALDFLPPTPGSSGATMLSAGAIDSLVKAARAAAWSRSYVLFEVR